MKRVFFFNAAFAIISYERTVAFTVSPPRTPRLTKGTPTSSSSDQSENDTPRLRTQGTPSSTSDASENDSSRHPEIETLGINMPHGLYQTLRLNSCDSIAKRFWIVDNSGSMALWDGVYSSSFDQHKEQHCTRWCEVQETVSCHAQLSAALGAPTDFTLLNPSGGLILRGPQRFRVGYGLNRSHHHVVKDYKRARSIMLRSEPTGRTPLPESIKDVRREIIQMIPELEKSGGKACIVIATDGCNYNAQNVGLQVNEEERNMELLQALKSLQGLPVNVVIRLCTDYQPLVEFYNNLDQHLEGVDIDVLDDHRAEAEEVYQHNPWLNYALILHRMREMGQDCRLFDLLDERPFTKQEIIDFCSLLFGSQPSGEGNDWKTFLEEVDNLQRYEKMQWNPRTKSMASWIDIGELAKLDS